MENVDRCGPQAMLVLGLVAEGLQHRSECPKILHSLVHAHRSAREHQKFMLKMFSVVDKLLLSEFNQDGVF